MTDALLKWFKEHQRVLPWRVERTPYRAWVSEIMLQQTQVATVIPYFERWMSRYPDIATLAATPLDDVLKSWEGLGYYRRARLLHQASQQVLHTHDGDLPRTYEALRELPGVGSYTAGAIASMVFGEDVLAVDGNIKRVAARLFAMPGEVTEKGVKEKLEPFLPTGRAGVFNEALMELGATVCTPRNPRCDLCPVRQFCEAFKQARVAEFPSPKPRRVVPHHHRYALINLQKGSLWLRQRDPDEMLGGLWGFPLTEASPETGQALPTVQHLYTHLRVTATPVVVDNMPPDVPGEAIPIRLIPSLALSKLDHKILANIPKDRLGYERPV